MNPFSQLESQSLKFQKALTLMNSMMKITMISNQNLFSKIRKSQFKMRTMSSNFSPMIEMKFTQVFTLKMTQQSSHIFLQRKM